MLGYLLGLAVLGVFIGAIVALDRTLGKGVDRWVNSLPLRKQIILGIAALAVIGILWLLARLIARG